MEKRRHEHIPAMDYQQYRRARRLVRECCNYDSGQCIVLDEGDGCVCVQSISRSVLCRWFRAAVLPLDKELETELLYRAESKKCAARMKRKHAAERKRKQRRLCHALGTEKAL